MKSRGSYSEFMEKALRLESIVICSKKPVNWLLAKTIIGALSFYEVLVILGKGLRFMSFGGKKVVELKGVLGMVKGWGIDGSVKPKGWIGENVVTMELSYSLRIFISVSFWPIAKNCPVETSFVSSWWKNWILASIFLITSWIESCWAFIFLASSC